MSRIDCIKLESWEKFKVQLFRELYSDHKYNSGKYIFRGHKISTWRLESSFDRWAKDVPLANRFSEFNKLLTEFRRLVSSSIDFQYLSDENKEHELLGFAQHYGLTTRLLDWTYSPYVAAFFAFGDSILDSSKNLGENSCIWALDTEAMVWSENDAGARIISGSNIRNERLRNQEGCFTYLTSPFECIEDYVDAFHDMCDNVMIKFEIPISETMKALSDLEAMGINYRRVYPEMEGIVKSAKNNFLMRNEKNWYC